jgi:arylsulfatase A-like enzyme
MGSIFTGRYAARLRWRKEKMVAGGARLGELLQKKGFHTIHISSYPSIAQGSGVLGTFDREVVARPRPGQEYALAAEVLPLGLQEIAKVRDQSMFVYMHWLDAHYPYDSVGGKGPSPMAGYLREMEQCDEKLGELRSTLETMGLWKRVVLVLTADHGEGFGDHGVFAHGKGLYEAILRVPMMIRVPGVAPGIVGTPVSGIDIGPTLLDLAGRSTPGEFLGQSLVGFLRGESPVLDRPVAAALKGAKAAVFGRYKVIDDERKNTTEVYDLREDPKERMNIYGTLGGKDAEMRSALNRFFAVPQKGASAGSARPATAKR